jgi:shikimate kinase
VDHGIIKTVLNDSNKALTLMTKNIILIGMPGAGKSTIGLLLAKQLGKDFVDTDIMIQVAHGKTLQQIIHKTDYLTLRQYEEQILVNLQVENKVIATGGSAVYSQRGMQQLKANGVAVFLDVSLERTIMRISNFDERGIARRSDQSLADLYAERRPLYQQHADITLDCNLLDIEQTLQKVIEAVANH